jgi:hypothetical protein
MADFIPSQDPQALIWMQTFSAGISANPSLYLLTAPDAATIAAAVHEFDLALAESSDPATRTAVTVAQKDDSRTAAEAVCRQFAILIKYNAGISDPDKIAIGVRPVNPSREPIECPQTSPLLNVIAATPGVQTLRYADSTTPITDPEAARFYGKFTRNPIGVDFEAADNGKQATYFARWASRRGETGPWSLPVTMAIAA